MGQSDRQAANSPPPTVALVQYAGQVDHFAGLDGALAARSVRTVRVNEWELDELGFARAGLVAVKDCESPLSLAALRWARRQGVPTLLLMDGVLEYRNTFTNPDAPEGFLRPAPVDVVACAGESDRARLWSWGNVAIATGLPRIAAAFPRPLAAAGEERLLIATARRPAFDAAERERIVAALRRVQQELRSSAWCGRVAWRLTGGLEEEIGVVNDPAPLRQCLEECSAVLCTPSTLLLEAMSAGRACGIVHPQDGPLWQEAMGEWRGEGVGSPDRLDELLERLRRPGEPDWRRQARALERMNAASDPSGAWPEKRLADAMLAMLRGELCGGPGRKRQLPGVRKVVLGAGAERQRDRRRVVSCVTCDSTPIGGVMTWSLRMNRAFADAGAGLGYDFRTLVVAMQPAGWRSEEFDPTLTPGVDLCVVDPMADHHERIETIRGALEALAPDIVLPNYNDACYMAAALLKPRGVRTVAIAHADDEYYRKLAGTYDTWSAAVGVSASCMEWLGPLAGGRTVEKVVYGVPVAAELWQREAGQRGREPHEPLRIAYIGRMVEEQKRIGDLLVLADELEARGAACELNMVGDGPDLATWRGALLRRRHEQVRIVVHGRRSPEWVERFLPTMDACVLVSTYEGTSVVMLEAMGQGVVPVVTDVRSGVREWVRHGENGVIVPIGDMARMAAELAALRADRRRLDAMKRSAWETIRGSGLSIGATAAAYARVFDAAVAREIDPEPTDSGLVPTDLWRWDRGGSAEDAVGADAWCASMLREAGYRSIAMDAPADGCDAVLVRAGRAEPVGLGEVRRWRERGLGVAVSPHLRQDGVAARALHLVREAVERGRARIAIYPAGRHTRRIVGILRDALWTGGGCAPFVGFLDDGARPGQTALGLPVVRPAEACDVLEPDAVLLSSDAFEPALWERTLALRERGVEVIPMYGEYPVAKQRAVETELKNNQELAHADRAR